MKRLLVLLCAALMLTGCTGSVVSESSGVSEGDGSGEIADSTSSATSASDTTSSAASAPVTAEVVSGEETVPATKEQPSEPEPVQEPECEYAEFFREDKVHEMNIEISEADWYAMIDDPYSKTYRRANITIDGITVNDAGIHPRGGTSLDIAYNTGNGRLPLKIKFDEFVPKGRFMGLDELALDNSACDGSYLRQYVGLEAFRVLGMDVPYVTFFNVSVNGRLHGVFAGIEMVDSCFLERAFGSHKHNLYKADYFASLTPDMSSTAFEQKKGTDESQSDIRKLIEVLDETPLGEKGKIPEYIDVDSVLKILAVDAVIHNWDGYAGEVAHNYYLYMADSRFQMIPWDLNEAFLQTEAGEREGLGSHEDIATPITGYTLPEARPLAYKLMAVDEYYEQYIAYCAQVNEWLGEFGETRLPELADMLRDYVAKDPTRFYKSTVFDKQMDTANRNGIAGFIKERVEFLNARIPEIVAEKGLSEGQAMP